MESYDVDADSLHKVNNLVRYFDGVKELRVMVFGVDSIAHAKAMYHRLDEMVELNGWEVSHMPWLQRAGHLGDVLRSTALHLDQLIREAAAGADVGGSQSLLARDVCELQRDPLLEVSAELEVLTDLLRRLAEVARMLRGKPQWVTLNFSAAMNGSLERAASLIQQLLGFRVMCEAAKPPTVAMGVKTKTETIPFQSETSHLISVLSSSSTSNKEIFLRELISNSSDALDKRSFTDKLNVDAQQELFIKIYADKAVKTITVMDNGIGMTKSDLIKNLGKIVRSGTNEFMAALSAGADVSMIGFFGVGFYSVFLVAERVTVSSKHMADKQYVWDSEAGGSFTIKEDFSGTPLDRGTNITLYLKDEELGFLEEDYLKNLIMKHSRVISYPISLHIIETTIEDPDCHAKYLRKKFDDSVRLDNMTAFFPTRLYSEVKDKKMTVIKTRMSFSIKSDPIWLRNPQEITKDEYADFYKSLTKDWEKHLAVKHFSVEGKVKFKAILFVPKRASFNLSDTRKNLEYIRLYVRGVFIMDNCDELIPEWLSFVSGIVDTEDLPLNTPPETLHRNNAFRVIRDNLFKNCIELFFEIAENKEDYKLFYKAFSNNIKLCFHDNYSNKKIAELLRYHSTKSGDELTSLKDYVNRMEEGQSDIYYILGESKKAVENSPFLKMLKEMGHEVLFMVDTIDKCIVDQVKEFQGRKLRSAIRESLKLDTGHVTPKRKLELEIEENRLKKSKTD